VTVLATQMPAHTHALQAYPGEATIQAAAPANSLARSNPTPIYTPPGGTQTTLATSILGPAGGNLPHNNLMPYLTLNFCIAPLAPPAGWLTSASSSSTETAEPPSCDGVLSRNPADSRLARS
jgi:microcystin-dependent protein